MGPGVGAVETGISSIATVAAKGPETAGGVIPAAGKAAARAASKEELVAQQGLASGTEATLGAAGPDAALGQLAGAPTSRSGDLASGGSEGIGPGAVEPVARDDGSAPPENGAAAPPLTPAEKAAVTRAANKARQTEIVTDSARTPEDWEVETQRVAHSVYEDPNQATGTPEGDWTKAQQIIKDRQERALAWVNAHPKSVTDAGASQADGADTGAGSGSETAQQPQEETQTLTTEPPAETPESQLTPEQQKIQQLEAGIKRLSAENTGLKTQVEQLNKSLTEMKDALEFMAKEMAAKEQDPKKKESWLELVKMLLKMTLLPTVTEVGGKMMPVGGKQ